MKPTVNKKASLIRKYHTLCSKLGMTDEAKRQMLWDNFEVASSKDLYIDQLESLCRNLDNQIDADYQKLKQARLRVFGAVGGWLDILYGKIAKNDIEKRKDRTDKIKAIACRQTGYKDFNKIPIERLSNVSHLFSNKQKDYTRGTLQIEAELGNLAYLN